ncbi:MAG: hydrogenase iron-sulfur subunit, partial [Sulfolobales archaeon]
AASDNAGILKLQYPAVGRTIRLLCSSRVSWKHIERAFARGAGMVLVTGCRLGDCHFITANYNTVRRFEMWRKRIEHLGIRPERLQLRLFGAPDVTDLVEAMREAERVIASLKPEEVRETIVKLGKSIGR